MTNLKGKRTYEFTEVTSYALPAPEGLTDEEVELWADSIRIPVQTETAWEDGWIIVEYDVMVEGVTSR